MGVIQIDASEVWGALYGLTSVAQLVMSTSLNEVNQDCQIWSYIAFQEILTRLQDN